MNPKVEIGVVQESKHRLSKVGDDETERKRKTKKEKQERVDRERGRKKIWIEKRERKISTIICYLGPCKV